MKYLLSTLFFALLLMSCGSDGADSSAGSTQINTNVPAVTPATSPLPGEANSITPPQQQTVNIPAGPDGVLHHYICAKEDGGNGGAAGPCPVCGEAMAHNSAFHANQNQQQAPAANIPPITINNGDGTTSSPISVSTTPPPGAVAPGATPPATPEPPQNSKGVWHYTCTNGCGGGAGAASACAGCGSTLVHNPVYHQ